MNRVAAIQVIRSGNTLKTFFYPDDHGTVNVLEVWIRAVEPCNFMPHKQFMHQTIGPIHLLFQSGNAAHWIHINNKQLLGFIKRNFSR